jgi:hypothetical protein
MNKIKPKILQEITDNLDFGLRAYIRKTKNKIIFLPEDREMIDEECWKKDFEELEKNIDEYIEINKWTSSYSFEIMNNFMEDLSNKPLQKKLHEALNNKNPFKIFKLIIENETEFKKQWFEYKNNCQLNFVKKQIRNLLLK